MGKITWDDLCEFSLEDVKKFRKELDKIVMSCEKLKELGVEIDGKTLQEVSKLSKECKCKA